MQEQMWCLFEMASNFGAKDCFNLDNYHEIILENQFEVKKQSESDY